jgi:hypothetical protein
MRGSKLRNLEGQVRGCGWRVPPLKPTLGLNGPLPIRQAIVGFLVPPFATKSLR